MTLVKYNPVRRNLFPGFSNLIDDFFNDEFVTNRLAGTVPSVNVRETDEAYFVELGRTGYDKN